MPRVQTGCSHCKRCTNSAAAETWRTLGRFCANLCGWFLISAFTPNCRGCGHKLSRHVRNDEPTQGNAYAAPIYMAPFAVRTTTATRAPTRQAGWYPDPAGMPYLRWHDGREWTRSTTTD